MYFIVGVSVAWVGYALFRVVRDPSELARWGFGWRGFGPSMLGAGLFALVAVAALAGIVFGTGLRDHAIAWHPDMLLLQALYPLWGLVQQFLVQAMVAGNLAPATADSSATARGSAGPSPSLTRRAPWVALLCALLFGAVHLPNWPLCASTFTMGLAFTPIYLRWRNLWPLALFHGWLGVPAYFWLLGVNPLRESLA
jgi:hypothetical protein